MKKILFVVAMEEEIKPLVKLLSNYYGRPMINLLNHNNVLKHRLYEDTEFLCDAVVTGVGMVNSMLTLSSMRDELRDYGLIINLGSVGARGNYSIGDIVEVGPVYNGDFDLTMFGYDRYEVPKLGKYIYLTGPKDNVCVTLSRFLSDSSSIEGFNNYVVDMELFGIASMLNSMELMIPIVSYKVVTDTADGSGSKKEHESNLENLSDKLCAYLFDKFVLSRIV